MVHDLKRVSVAADGSQLSDYSTLIDISADGDTIVFMTATSGLDAGDSGSSDVDIFVKTVSTGALTLVTPDSDSPVGNQSGQEGSLSTNGQFIVFESNLGSGGQQIYRKDLVNGTVTLVSAAQDGTPDSTLPNDPAISPNGQMVVFESNGSFSHGDDTPNTSDIFLKDLQTGALTVVSQSTADGSEIYSSNAASFSGNGRYVVFDGFADNGSNNHDDVFRYDTVTGAIELVSTPLGGATSDGDSRPAAVSSDGRYVVFASAATNLVAGDTNGSQDVFRKDMVTGALSIVSAAADGTFGNDRSRDASVSGDGRFVAFTSEATNFGEGNGMFQVFVKDMDTDAIALLSKSAAGVLADDDSYAPLISEDGKTISFTTAATNLVDTDTNATFDVFEISNPFANSAPTAQDDAFDAALDEVLIGDVLADNGNGADSDPEGDPLTVSLVAGPGSGTLNLQTDGSFTYTPDGGYVGTDTFTYQASDGSLPSGTATVTINVQEVSDLRLVSTHSDGLQRDGESGDPALSDDGSVVAFDSFAALVDEDINGFEDVYLKTLSTGVTTLVSSDASGAIGNGASSEAVLSGDGRYAVFISEATNLVAGDTNGEVDLFRKDLQTGAIERVSTAADGTEANGRTLFVKGVSDDGRYIVFENRATNLVADDDNGSDDIFVKDMATGAVTLLPRLPNGEPAASGANTPSISDDGRYVAFKSRSSDLTGSPIDSVMVADLVAGTVQAVSTDSGGTAVNGGSFPFLSGNGRYVTFSSYDGNIAAGDTNGTSDIFRKDLQTGALEIVTATSGGVVADSASFLSSMSDNGRYVVFRSGATNLTNDAANGYSNIFVKDMVKGTVARVSEDRFGNNTDGSSFDLAISGDGRTISFSSQANNLHPDDQQSAEDAFVVSNPLNNKRPVASVPDQSLNIGEYAWVRLNDVLTVSDPDGDTITQYRLHDDTGLHNWWADGGTVNATAGYVTSDLSGVWFQRDYVASTQTLSVEVFDGEDWSDIAPFTLTTVQPNRAPEAMIEDQTIALDDPPWLRLSNVFSFTDADGDAITQYRLYDDTGIDNWWADGGVVDASAGYTTNDLSGIWFKRDDAASTQTLSVEIFDGEDWSAPEEFSLTTVPGNRAPVVSVDDQVMAVEDYGWVALSSVLNATDPDGDAITHYHLYDNTGVDNWWADGGFVDASNGYTTSDLPGIWFKRDDTASMQTLWIQASDGEDWSDWDSFNLITTQQNAPPVVSIENQTIALSEYEWRRLDDVLSVTDAENDAITRYQLWDSEGGDNWWADGGIVDATDGYATENLSGIWFKRDDVASEQRLWVRAHDGESWSAWEDFDLITA